MSLTAVFAASWNPNGVPTDVASATIVVTDNTTQTQVYSGAMTHTSTGNYNYSVPTPVAGHVYGGVITFVAVNGAQSVYTQVIYVPKDVTVPASSDDGSSVDDVAALILFRAQTATTYMLASAAIDIALAYGPAPNYSISAPHGSESMSMDAFIASMEEVKRKALEERKDITGMLQDQQPFDIRQRVGVGGFRRW